MSNAIIIVSVIVYTIMTLLTYDFVIRKETPDEYYWVGIALSLLSPIILILIAYGYLVWIIQDLIKIIKNKFQSKKVEEDEQAD